ncbi:MAG TPA: acyl-CoA dehydrogenase family protein [Steroidobacteraceae bacterium]|jgi:alkylation response protein AidB-like acyl-CoA dehydrogenase
MDLELNEDQRAVHEAIVRMVSRHAYPPRDRAALKPSQWIYADALERELEAGEFFSLALSPCYGALEAALLVYETGRSPFVVEAAGSALIGALLCGRPLARPVAVARLEDLPRGVRFLDRAKTIIIDLESDVMVVPVDHLDVESIHSMYAYPLGRVRKGVDVAKGRLLGAGAVSTLRKLWRTSLAVEAAAAMQAAVDFTAAYVKERHVFGRPVGSFQAVQHRLSIDAHKARAAYWLALKAAWTGGEADAATAALYAQESLTSVNYDAHQFNGALGMTLEHDLHFWTFRMRWLQGELAGARNQAAALAAFAWPS